MKNIPLTDDCLAHFLNQNNYFIRFLPEWIINLAIIRWFNKNTKMQIDTQNWEDDGFDYAIFHPYENKVYHSSRTAGNRHKDYDICIKECIQKANIIYNGGILWRGHNEL